MDGGTDADVVMSETEETMNMDLDSEHAEVLFHALVL